MLTRSEMITQAETVRAVVSRLYDDRMVSYPSGTLPAHKSIDCQDPATFRAHAAWCWSLHMYDGRAPGAGQYLQVRPEWWVVPDGGSAVDRRRTTRQLRQPQGIALCAHPPCMPRTSPRCERISGGLRQTPAICPAQNRHDAREASCQTLCATI